MAYQSVDLERELAKRWPDVIERFDDEDPYAAMSTYVVSHRAESDAYYKWIADVIRTYLGSRTLELGSGPGLLCPHLHDFDLYVATETWPPFVEELNRMALGRAEMRVERIDVSALSQHIPRLTELEFDSVFSTNLLEHVKDDIDALRQMSRVLRPGGRVVNLVPAFRRLFGPVDRSVGHFRRYEREELVAKYRAAGLVVKSISYFNLAGFLSWALIARVLHSQNVSQGQFRIFNTFVPAMKVFERLIPPLVGSSLICVGSPEA